MTKLSRNIALLLGLGLSGVGMCSVVLAQTAPAVSVQANPLTGAIQPPKAAPAVGQPSPAPVYPTVAAPAGMQVTNQSPASQTATSQMPTEAPASAQLPPPGTYAQQVGSAFAGPSSVPVNQYGQNQYGQAAPGQAPSTPPSSLPPLPGPNTAEVAHAEDALMGVTPEQIRQLRRMLDARQRASAELPNQPKPVTGSISVSLSPGATPPVIRPFMGSTSSFVVVDSTGAPWPVENFRIANADLFPVNRLDGPQGSAFTIDTMVPYGQSNLVLKLAGVSTPVVISLVAGQPEQDARVEIRVQGRGPNSHVASGSLMAGTDARMLPVLDGISPPGGKLVTVSGLDGVRAWIMPNGRMLVRSPVQIVSPASTSFITSADGTHVYEFSQTTQLLGLVDGQFVQMTVSGW